MAEGLACQRASELPQPWSAARSRLTKPCQVGFGWMQRNQQGCTLINLRVNIMPRRRQTIRSFAERDLRLRDRPTTDTFPHLLCLPQQQTIGFVGLWRYALESWQLH